MTTQVPASGPQSGSESNTIQHRGAQRRPICSSCGAESKLLPSKINITHQESHALSSSGQEWRGNNHLWANFQTCRLISKCLGSLEEEQQGRRCQEACTVSPCVNLHSAVCSARAVSHHQDRNISNKPKQSWREAPSTRSGRGGESSLVLSHPPPTSSQPDKDTTSRYKPKEKKGWENV